MVRRPPRPTRTDTRFPYTTLFRSSETVPQATERFPPDAGFPAQGFTSWPSCGAERGFAQCLSKIADRPPQPFLQGHGRLPVQDALRLADIGPAAPRIVWRTRQELTRSEERRVGKERVSPCRSRWSPSH